MPTPLNSSAEVIRRKAKALEESMRSKQTGEYIRNCVLYFKEENIGQEKINKIINWYQRGRELADIVRAINGNFNSISDRHKKVPAIAMIDIYAVLYAALQKKQVKQRKEHLSFEMQLEDFYQFFICWRKGYTELELQTIKTIKATKVARDRVLVSIRNRFNTLNREIKEVSTGKLLEVLRSATPSIIDGRPCYIVWMDDVPPDTLEEYNLPRLDTDPHQIPTSLPPLHTNEHTLRTGETLTITSLPAREVPIEDSTGDTLDNLVWGDDVGIPDDSKEPATAEQTEELLAAIEEAIPNQPDTPKEALKVKDAEEPIDDAKKNDILMDIFSDDDD